MDNAKPRISKKVLVGLHRLGSVINHEINPVIGSGAVTRWTLGPRLTITLTPGQEDPPIEYFHEDAVLLNVQAKRPSRKVESSWQLSEDRCLRHCHQDGL